MASRAEEWQQLGHEVAVVGAVHQKAVEEPRMVAQEFVLNHPERVRTLVLGCTYAGGEGSTLDSPGVPKMFAASRTGDAEAAVRAGYEANLSATYRADETRWPMFHDLALAEQQRHRFSR